MAGNSLDAWRRAIGTFNSGKTKSIICPTLLNLVFLVITTLASIIFKVCLSRLTLKIVGILIKLLLLMAGIEPNPGPDKRGVSLHDIKILHTNLNGFCDSKMEELRDLSTSYDVIAITETKLVESANHVNLNIPNFTLLTRHRGTTTRGGGVGIYIRNSIYCQRHKELEHPDIELMWVELRSMNTSCMLAVCYRPPSSISEFWTNLDDCLGKYEYSYNCPFILMGDLNADPRSPYGTKLKELCHSHSLNCNIKEATRVSSIKRVVIDPVTKQTRTNPETGEPMTTFTTSTSILDQFLTKQDDQTFRNFKVLNPITKCDHCPISCSIDIKTSSNRRYEHASWSWSKANFAAMRNTFKQVDWALLFDNKSLDNMVHAFNSVIIETLNKYCPKRRFTFRDKNSDWYTGELRILKRKVGRYFSIYRKTHKPSDYERYKTKQHEYNTCLTTTKKAYFAKTVRSIDESKSSDPRKWWALTKKLLGMNKTSLIPTIKDNIGQFTSDGRAKANVFNNHFASFSQLSDQPSTLPHQRNRLTNLSAFSVSLQDVEDQMKNLKNTNSTGSDEIPSRVLKECATDLAPGVLAIIQKSLLEGRYPNLWKEANVTPIFKNGDRSLATNYRPISLLSVCSKIIERIVFRQMFNFIRDQNLLYRQQSGFIPGDSCVNQLVYLYDMIMKAMENKKQVKFVFCDITKAFDRVWHEGLLHKLSNFGFDYMAKQWLANYLSNRKQRVVVDNETSEWTAIHAGVPQGSVLGPLLFLIYINDLPSGMSSGVSMFADDTCLYIDYTRDDQSAKQTTLQDDIATLEAWSKQWLVTFNPKKTNVLTVHTRQSRVICNQTHMLGETIRESNNHKHLGITFGEFGNWTDHITDICTRARRKVNMVRPLKYKLPRQSLLILVNAFVRPTLEYGSVVWDNCSRTEKQMIDKTYEDALRIVCGAPCGSSRAALYKETNQLSLQTRRDRYRLLQMHQLVHDQAPSYMAGMVERTRECRESRQFDTRPPFARRSCYYNSFVPMTCRDWNALPTEIKRIENKKQFKAALDKETKYKKTKANAYYNLGSRFVNILLSRLRMGCSDLNADRFRRGLNQNKSCACGEQEESSKHYITYCPLYDTQRAQLYQELPNISKTLFLEGANTIEENLTIIKAVSKFLLSTKRFDIKN